MKTRYADAKSYDLKPLNFKKRNKISLEKSDALAKRIDDILYEFDADETRQLKQIKALLKQGANPNVKLYQDYTILLHALAMKRFEVAKLLIQAGADVFAKESYRGHSPLYYAAVNGSYELVRILVERGALKNFHNSTTVLLLTNTLKEGKHIDQIVPYLLQNGVNLNEKEALTGNTPLFYAAAQGSKICVVSLLQYGINPLVKNHMGKTAYDIAITKNLDIANLIEQCEQLWIQKQEAKQREDARLEGIFEDVLADIKEKVVQKNATNKNKAAGHISNPTSYETEKEIK